jgi:MoaA/NifB/PqqE/SkfB family radical SAM enzyme
MQDKYIAVEPEVMITISDLWCDAKKDGRTLARGNPDMGKFLQSCDGTQTIAEIVRAHIDSEEYFEESLEFAVYLTGQLVDSGVLRLADEAQSCQVRSTMRSTVSPGVVTLELTDACCLECDYCYKSSGPKRQRYLEQPLHLLSYLHSIEVAAVELSGGEPLMHPQIDQILEMVCAEFDACSLLSNGILLREKHLEIMQGGQAKTQVQISLDGPDAETVDRAVGVPGSFERILSSIRLLKRYDMKFRVAMTISSVEAMEKVERTLLLARSLGAGMFVPVLVLDFGRSEGNLLMRDKDVSQRFMETQLRLMDDYQDFYKPESGTAAGRDAGARHGGSMVRLRTTKGGRQDMFKPQMAAGCLRCTVCGWRHPFSAIYVTNIEY